MTAFSARFCRLSNRKALGIPKGDACRSALPLLPSVATKRTAGTQALGSAAFQTEKRSASRRVTLATEWTQVLGFAAFQTEKNRPRCLRVTGRSYRGRRVPSGYTRGRRSSPWSPPRSGGGHCHCQTPRYQPTWHHPQ